MNALIIAEALRGVRLGLNFWMATRDGNREAALGVVRAYQVQGARMNLDSGVREAVAYAAAGLNFIAARGLAVDAAVELLDEFEDGDIPDDVVQAFLDGTRAVGDRVEDKLQALENEEAPTATGGAQADPPPPGAPGGEPVTGAESVPNPPQTDPPAPS